jgi:hypothetical protein
MTNYRFIADTRVMTSWFAHREVQITKKAVHNHLRAGLELPPQAQLFVTALSDSGPGAFRLIYYYQAETDDEHIAHAKAIVDDVRQLDLLITDAVIEGVTDHTLKAVLAGGLGGGVVGLARRKLPLAAFFAVGGAALLGWFAHSQRKAQPVFSVRCNLWGPWHLMGIDPEAVPSYRF